MFDKLKPKTATERLLRDATYALMMARAAGTPHDLIPVNVPASLWAGKPFEVAFKNLEGKFAEEVIALILVEQMGCDKKAAGAFFYPDDGDYKEDRTYQRKIDRLIESAKTRYSFTFDE